MLLFGMYFYAMVQIVAVAARKLEDAQAFALRFSITKAYGSYEELAQDDEIGLFVLLVMRNQQLHSMFEIISTLHCFSSYAR